MILIAPLPFLTSQKQTSVTASREHLGHELVEEIGLQADGLLAAAVGEGGGQAHIGGGQRAEHAASDDARRVDDAVHEPALQDFGDRVLAEAVAVVDEIDALGRPWPRRRVRSR